MLFRSAKEQQSLTMLKSDFKIKGVCSKSVTKRKTFLVNQARN